MMGGKRPQRAVRAVARPLPQGKGPTQAGSHLLPSPNPLPAFPRWHSGTESLCQYRRRKRPGFHPWVGKIPWSSKWQPAPVFLPGKPHGQGSLAGYGPRGGQEKDPAEHTRTLNPLPSVILLPHLSDEETGSEKRGSLPRGPQPPTELEGDPEPVQAECGCFTTSLNWTGDSAHPAGAQRGPAAWHTPDSRSVAEAEADSHLLAPRQRLLGRA